MGAMQPQNWKTKLQLNILKHTWNFLKTSINTFETALKHSFNFFYILLKLPWINFKSLLEHQLNFFHIHLKPT